MRLASFPVLVLTVALALAGAGAEATTRDDEIAQCRPGEVSTWGDGVDRKAISSPVVLVYRHQGAPAWFSEGLVLGKLQAAAKAWSACGIAGKVLRETDPAHTPAGSVLVQWNSADSRGNFGLANLTARTLSLSPAAFQLLRERNPGYDATQTLQMVISHEMGHLYGLMAHSRRCVDVTSYYNNGKGESCYLRDARQFRSVVEYRSTLPTACDIQRCRMANA
ncbi:MAG: hypothetical protein JOY60_09780, partial [Burkholderiaceae bacterium]|nr:hypothetical protein [Burkholderiaceae bacterium]